MPPPADSSTRAICTRSVCTAWRGVWRRGSRQDVRSQRGGGADAAAPGVRAPPTRGRARGWALFVRALDRRGGREVTDEILARALGSLRTVRMPEIASDRVRDE